MLRPRLRIGPWLYVKMVDGSLVPVENVPDGTPMHPTLRPVLDAMKAWELAQKEWEEKD